MGKGSAANVIDLEAFRQRKLREAQSEGARETRGARETAMLMPVWVCWVPVWAPVLP